MTIRNEIEDQVKIITIDRPERKNAVDCKTAQQLYESFIEFEKNNDLKVAILTGSENQFCAGADLKAISEGDLNRLEPKGSAPMGPTRLHLKKPLIAAIEGHAVAGGLELALLADLRVASEESILGVFCRRVGIPLIDGGTVRLPRIIGLGRALDMILTGRQIDANESLNIGLINRITKKGKALDEALNLAKMLIDLPERAMLSDRQSVYEQSDLSLEKALENEFLLGVETLKSKEGLNGAQQFSKGKFRHGHSK